MSVKLLTKYHLEFLGLKYGCISSSESRQVKMPHCWKSHDAAHIVFAAKSDCVDTIGDLCLFYCFC